MESSHVTVRDRAIPEFFPDIVRPQCLRGTWVELTRFQG
jgi:hypothetical protein